jgi:hypothetical protein
MRLSKLDDEFKGRNKINKVFLSGNLQQKLLDYKEAHLSKPQEAQDGNQQTTIRTFA